MTKVASILLRTILFILGLLPLCLLYVLSELLSLLAHHVIRYRQSVVRDNLAKSFPDKSRRELRKIERQFYRHFTDLFVEAVWMASSIPARIRWSRILDVEGADMLRRTVDEGRKSAVILVSHTGNWELTGALVHADRDFGAIPLDNLCFGYRRLSSRVWDIVIKDVRTHFCGRSWKGYVESANLIRYCFKNRDRSMVYFFNSDQRPYFKAPDYVTVNFMNRTTRTMSGAAAVAVKFSSAVFYERMTVVRRGKYKVEFIPICDDASAMTVEQIMTKYYEMLQEDIERQPFNYLWSHRRWK